MAQNLVALNIRTDADNLYVKFNVRGGVQDKRKANERTDADKNVFQECVNVMHEHKGRYSDSQFWIFPLLSTKEVSVTYIDDEGLWSEEVTKIERRTFPTVKLITESLNKKGFKVTLRNI